MHPLDDSHAPVVRVAGGGLTRRVSPLAEAGFWLGGKHTAYPPGMSSLADAVLPRIRSRAELWRWSTANAHGAQMHEAVDVLAGAAATDPVEAFSVTQRALASAIKVVMRADDSSGIIGDACRRLLALHAATAAPAGVAPAKLVAWMIAFQFDQDCDVFTIDPVAYAPALGEVGMAAYRRRLAERRALLGPEPDGGGVGHSSSRDWFTIHYNDRRLAVFDRDADAIIRTHARDQRVPAWLRDTAEAFAEIGEFDLAIEWAERAVAHPIGGHQSVLAARYLAQLVAAHRPAALLGTTRSTFERWPTAAHAAALREASGPEWSELREHVLGRLASNPREAVQFALTTLKEPTLAWTLAHELGLTDTDLWSRVLTAYEKVDPVATLPVHSRLVVEQLVDAEAQNYRYAARRLARMRRLASGTDHAAEVDEFIADLRQEHRRRPRLQQEFTKAGLP